MEVNKKIIVIDDQKEILESLKKLLTGKDSLKNITSKLDDLVKDFFDDKEEEEDKLAEEVYEVDTAERGEKGYNLIKEALFAGLPYSVALIDMRMPGWDGLKTAQEIRKIDKNIEIVIITAYTDRNREEILKSVGTPEKLLYLKKPFDREEILQVVLSLTLKWSLENQVKEQLEVIKETKDGLENIIFGVNKIEDIKLVELDNILQEIQSQVIEISGIEKGYLEFFNDEIYTVGVGKFKKVEDDEYDKLKEVAFYKKGIFYYEDYLVIPFFDEEKLMAISILEKGEKEDLNENQMKILKIFSSQANNIIKNSKLYSELEKANTELKERNERLKLANELNKKFIVLSSHELRTPITLISGYSQLLENNIYNSDFDREKMYIGLKNSSKRLTKIINQMLEIFAMSDKGEEIIIKKTRTNIEDVYNKLKEKLEFFLTARKQKFVLKKENDIPELNIDENKVIDFVLFNIVINAIKYSEDGEVIELAVKYSKDDKKTYLSVKDRGVGISKEDLEKIYTPFFVSGNEHHHHSGIYEFKSSGLGLGLTVVKNMINILNETIECRSEEGKGTTIRFTLSD